MAALNDTLALYRLGTAASIAPSRRLAFLPAFHSPFRAIVLFACATVIVLQDLAWAGDSLKVDTAGAMATHSHLLSLCFDTRPEHSCGKAQACFPPTAGRR